MAWISYALKKKFTGDPKTITNLRDQTRDKLAEWKEKGSFLFVMESAKDDQATMVVSWTGNAWEKSYAALAKPKKDNDEIRGTYQCEPKKKTYRLTVDPNKESLLNIYLKDPLFALRLWCLFPNDLEALFVNGKAVLAPQFNDDKLYSGSFNLTLAMAESGTEKSPLKGAKLPGAMFGEEKKQVFVTPNGIALPSEIPVRIQINGKVAKLAKENPVIWDWVRKDVSDAFAKLAEPLRDRLIEIDAKDAPKDKDKDKKKTVKLVSDLIDKFQENFASAVVNEVTEKWLVLVEAKVERRSYQIDCAVNLTKGTIGVVLGVSSAVVGGITGVGGVLGLIGTIKSSCELVVDLHRTFRSVNGLGDELNKTLVATLSAYATNGGWKDFGKTIASKIPGGSLVQMIGAMTGKPFKTKAQLSLDVKAYTGKVAGLIGEATKLGEKFYKVLDDAQAATKKLESKEVQEAEAENPKLKLSNAKKLKAIEKAVQTLVEKIEELSTGFSEGQKKLSGYKEILDLLDGEIDKDKWAKRLKTYLCPLLDMPYGIDPSSLATTLQTIGSTALDLTSAALQDLAELQKRTDLGDTASQMTDWVKYLNDSTSGLRGIVTSIKG